MSNMDTIDIQVSTSVSNANAELDKLITKLGAVHTSLSKIGGKSINFGSAVKQQSNAAKSGLNNVSSSMDKTTESTMSLASAFGTLYANFFWVIRGIKGLWNSIDSTADYMESYNYFNVAFNKIANDWSGDFEKYGYENAESYAESFTDRMNDVFSKLSGVEFDDENMRLASNNVKNLGLNIKEVTQYAAQLGSVTNSVGLTGEASLTASSVFTKLAGDLSSLYNVDYSSVSTNLQSGLIGQSRALYKYGIDITNATLQTYAYELGLEKAVSEMTQAEKMQLRMIAILDQSRVSWGNLANEIDQPSNQIRLFKNNLSEAAQILGQLFIPILSKVMPVVNGITIAVKNLLSNIAGLFGIQLNFSSTATDELADSYEDVSSSIDSVGASAKKAKTHLLGIDELNVVEPQTESGGTSSSGGGASGGIDLTDDIINAAAEYQKVWDEAYAQMESKAQAIADKLSVIFVPVEKLFKDIKIGDWFAVGSDVSDIVTGIFNLFSDAIASVDWYTIGNNIGLFLAGIDWTDIFSSVGVAIWQGINGAIQLWIGSFDSAPFETAFLTILALPKSVKSAISSPIEEMFALWTGGAGTLGESFMATFGTGGLITLALAALVIGLKGTYDENEEVRASFERATESISAGFKPLMELISNDILPNLQSAWNNLIEIFNPFAEFLDTVFVSIWQDMINPVLTYLGEAVLPMVTETLSNLWNNVFVPLGNFIASVFAPIIDILSFTLTVLWENVVVPLADAVGNILGKTFEGLVDIFNQTLIPIVNVVISIFQFLWDNVFEPLVNFLLDRFYPIFETVFEAIGGIIDGLSITFGGLIDFIAGIFTLNWEKALQGVQDIFKGISDGLVAIIFGGVEVISIVIKNTWDTIVEWTSNLFNSVGKFFEDLWIKICEIWSVVSDWFNQNVITPIVNFFSPIVETVTTFFSDLWENIKSVWSIVSTWFNENVIEPVAEFFVGFATRVGQVFEGLWIVIQGVWTVVSTWFNENVIQPVGDFFVGLATKVGEVFQNLWNGVQTVWTVVSGWFNNNVIIPTVGFFLGLVDSVSSFFSNLWEGIKSVWTSVSDWFTQNIINPLSTAFETVCNNISNFFSRLWDGIRGSVIGAMNAVIGGIESGINFIVSGINRIINGFNDIVSWAAEVAEVDWDGVDTVPNVYLNRIPAYEVGGFPEDGLFFANHTELVGRFTNGRTAVANNEQIISGISYGVKRAVEEVLAPYLADIAESNREVANKEFTTYIGDREIARANRRGQRSLGMQLITEY